MIILEVEQSPNGTTGWSTMINILSTNGTNTQTFTPTQPYVRVKFLSGNAYSLADMSLVSVDVDTSYSLIARGSYRYGYQGSERDDEVKGNGNSYNTFFRMLDPRLGRWLSVDPRSDDFPWQSPYCLMDNNPILLIDPMGSNSSKGGEKSLAKKEKKLTKEANRLSSEDYKQAKKDARGGGSVSSYKDKNGFLRYFAEDKDGDIIVSKDAVRINNKWDELTKRLDPVLDLTQGLYFEAGEVIGVQVSVGLNFFVGGGASFSVDGVFVGNSWAVGSTVGGGLGIEAGVDLSVQFIEATKSGRYNAASIQEGEGFAFSAGVWFLNYSRSGDLDKANQFAWNGQTATSDNMFLSNELLPANALSSGVYNQALNFLMLGSKFGKLKIGGSYQWTTSTVWGDGKY